MEKVWDVMHRLEIQSILIVPLLVKDDVIGSFSLDVTTHKRQFTSSEITLAQTIASQLSMAIQNARLLEQEHQRIEQELETAQQIQVSLLPASSPTMRGLDIACFSKPARVVGGDFYNFFPFDHDRLGIAIGDVSGKGMQAALMMALSVGLVSSEVRGDMTPGTLLTTLNRKVHPHTQRNWMNTAFSYLTITPIEAIGSPIEATGTPLETLETSDKNNQQTSWSVRVANAGLIAPLLCRKGLPTEWIDVKGLPLGIMPEVQYEQVHIILEPGDVIVLCSDGLVEAMNQDKSLYGFERLAACVASAPRQHAHMTLEHVLHDVQAFVDGAEMYDDLTIMIVKIQEE